MLSLVMAMALLADAAPAAPAAKAKVHPDTIVCKTEKVVGSKIKQRICMPAWQWEERRTDDSELLGKAQRNQPGIK